MPFKFRHLMPILGLNGPVLADGLNAEIALRWEVCPQTVLVGKPPTCFTLEDTAKALGVEIPSGGSSYQVNYYVYTPLGEDVSGLQVIARERTKEGEKPETTLKLRSAVHRDDFEQLIFKLAPKDFQDAVRKREKKNKGEKEIDVSVTHFAYKKAYSISIEAKGPAATLLPGQQQDGPTRRFIRRKFKLSGGEFTLDHWVGAKPNDQGVLEISRKFEMVNHEELEKEIANFQTMITNRLGKSIFPQLANKAEQ